MNKFHNLLAVGLVASAFVSLASGQTITALKPNQPDDACTLAWDHSTSQEVKGYFIYYGGESGAYTNRIDVGYVTAFTMKYLPRKSGKPVDFYYAATAYDGTGAESDFSNEVLYSTRPLPTPPGKLTGSNAVVVVGVQAAPTPKGPWSDYASVETSVAPQEKTFFRSAVTVQAVPMPLKVTPKRELPPAIPLLP